MSETNFDEELTGAMESLKERSFAHGDPSLQDGVLHFGQTALPKPDFEIVTLTQQDAGCEATIFALQEGKFIRVATTIHRDGTRGVGTELDPNGPVIGPVSRGDSYRGPADILGVAYNTYYEPITDSDGAVIGTFLVAYPQTT